MWPIIPYYIYFYVQQLKDDTLALCTACSGIVVEHMKTSTLKQIIYLLFLLIYLYGRCKVA
jgi:hypothetical protein